MQWPVMRSSKQVSICKTQRESKIAGGSAQVREIEMRNVPYPNLPDKFDDCWSGDDS